MTEPVSGLKIKQWYHALIAFGAAGCVAALALPMTGLPKAGVLLAFAGCFFIGLGEWVNHPVQTAFIPPAFFQSGWKITGYPRNAKPLGWAFDALGGVLALIGIVKITLA